MKITEVVVAEKRRRKKRSRSRGAAYGPGPYGVYGYLAGYSGEGGGEGMAEGLMEAVGGNYLYHATDLVGAKGILQSGSIRAASGPQSATQAQTKMPTVSVTRDWGYASGASQAQSQMASIGRDVVFVLDRNAIESNFKTLGTSQNTNIKGLAYNPYLKKDGEARSQNTDPMARANAKAKSKYAEPTAKAGGEFEEAVVVPKGALPLKGTMVGFWVNLKSELINDPTIMNDPRRLDMVRPNQFVKANEKQGVAEGNLNEIYKMPPTKNSSQGMTAWAYNDALEKKLPVVYQKNNVVIFRATDNLLRYIILQDNQPVLYIGFTKFLDGYKSGTVATEMAGRGKGLAQKAYLNASDILGVPIYSDSTQTDASRLGIWNKLIQQYPNRVVGYDQKSGRDLPLEITDQGPMVNQNQPIYVDRKSSKFDKPIAPNDRLRTRLLKLLPNTQQGVAEGSDNLSYIGNCTDDDVIEHIFGDATNFAQAVEEHGNEFTIGDLVVKYDPESDVHSFYYKKQGVAENFADGKKPGRKGLAKRMGVPTKASVSRLRQIAKSNSGEKQRMAHWMANMKAGKKK